MPPTKRIFDATKTLAGADSLSVHDLRHAIKTAIEFGRKDVALTLQAKLEQRTGLLLAKADRKDSLTNAWLAAGVFRVRNIQYSWSAIADDGVPVFTVWAQDIATKRLMLWSPAATSDAKGYIDRRQHALVALSRDGKVRAFAITGKRRGHELDRKTSSQIESASTNPFEACVERQGEELWLVWDTQ